MIEITGTQEYTSIVSVPRDEYEEMVEQAYKGEILTRVLIENARLGWNKGELTFSDEDIRAVLKTIEPLRYRMKLEVLSKEKEVEV